MVIPTLRDISIVILALEAFILGLIPLVAFYFAVRGLIWLRAWLKPKAQLLREYTAKGQSLIYTGTDKAAQVVIAPVATASEVGAIGREVGELARQGGAKLADHTTGARQSLTDLLRLGLNRLLKLMVFMGGLTYLIRGNDR